MLHPKSLARLYLRAELVPVTPVPVAYGREARQH